MFWKNSAKPFFNELQDFRNILPYIESFDLHEYSKFIKPGSCTERKLIIWRLCNHPRLEDFYNYAMDDLKVQQSTISNPDLERRILILNECGNLLNKIEPIYDWNDNLLIKKSTN